LNLGKVGLGANAAPMKPLRIVSTGLGPIGLAAARLLLEKSTLTLVGAVDPDPSKVGQDLGTLLGTSPLGLAVESDADLAYQRLKPDAILHCTSSFIPRVVEQLETAARHGVNVVSSSEELLVPDHRHPELAARLHRAALNGGATILGTGVNPGFAMDFVPVVASAVCWKVRGVRCRRVVDAGTRRLPLQRKVGAGLSVVEFRAKESAGGFGHIGMEESVVLLGRALGWKLDRVEQTLAPVIADREHQTEFLTVSPGAVTGIRNLGYGWVGDNRIIELDLTMAVGSENPRDEIVLDSDPPMKLIFEGGIAGDQATAAILVNNLHGVVAGPPGLLTVLDLPAPRCAT
jgi:4-hydroxy-tetrahydrodipicolinate reductase